MPTVHLAVATTAANSALTHATNQVRRRPTAPIRPCTLLLQAPPLRATSAASRTAPSAPSCRCASRSARGATCGWACARRWRTIGRPGATLRWSTSACRCDRIDFMHEHLQYCPYAAGSSVGQRLYGRICLCITWRCSCGADGHMLYGLDMFPTSGNPSLSCKDVSPIVRHAPPALCAVCRAATALAATRSQLHRPRATAAPRCARGRRSSGAATTWAHWPPPCTTLCCRCSERVATSSPRQGGESHVYPGGGGNHCIQCNQVLSQWYLCE